MALKIFWFNVVRPVLRTWKNRVLLPRPVELFKPDSWGAAELTGRIRKVASDQPGYFDSIPDPIVTASVRRHAFCDRSIFEVTDSVVRPRDGQLFLDRHIVVEAKSQFFGSAQAPFVSFKTRRSSRVPTVFLGQRPWNYYHWLLEDLPRILRVKRQLGSVGVALGKSAPGYVLESLELLSIPSDKVLVPTRFENLMVAATGKDAAWHHTEDVANLRESFSKYFEEALEPRAIYVSRRKSSRSMANEGELESCLTQVGVEVVYAEELTVREQIGKFSSATVVVGNHGAGLSNVVFGPAKQRVIELTSKHNANPCFQTLAHSLGRNYQRIYCEPGRLLDESEISREQIRLLISQLGSFREEVTRPVE